MGGNVSLLRCIFRYLITVLLLVIANKIMSFCSTYYEGTYLLFSIIGIIFMIRSGRKVWRRRRQGDETGLYIMHILNAYLCWSGAIWWAINLIVYVVHEIALYNLI